MLPKPLLRLLATAAAANSIVQDTYAFFGGSDDPPAPTEPGSCSLACYVQGANGVGFGPFGSDSCYCDAVCTSFNGAPVAALRA
eukprot:scaffold707_cov399-Prasinococcus_capsulatus_cf.AAC.22